MQKVKTESGFTCKIDDAIKDDMELLEDLAEISKGNLQYLPSALTRMLGEDAKAKLYEHCRGENGRVSTQKVQEEIKSIFDALGGETKN